ncbi:DUF192 domain-containing protein [Halomicrobium katesii]|uniref:DUF192 domain-containing protein n=1 Tax=Halomicrobium katesii TaxID=437163 RepID=UPI00036B022A|nr:DUF192 domain-containing protein [Halomicrobium katesii]
MRVVHEDGDERRTLADTVEVAASTVEQAKGLMFRGSIPDDYALVFRLHGPPWPLSALLGDYGYQSIHMLFVRFPIDVVWLRDEAVAQVKTLSPWTGLGMARADTVVELPAGAADGVEPGDRVVIES